MWLALSSRLFSPDQKNTQLLDNEDLFETEEAENTEMHVCMYVSLNVCSMKVEYKTFF